MFFAGGETSGTSALTRSALLERLAWMLLGVELAFIDAVALFCRRINHADTWSSVGVFSAFVDLYNATSNNWTTYPTGLVHARSFLAAASLPTGLVFFGGGRTSGEVEFVNVVDVNQQRMYPVLILHPCLHIL